MICTTIQNRNYEQILAALEECEMAEIRLDRCELTAKETDELFTSDVPLVATCRISEIAANDPSLQDLPSQSREIKAMQIAEKRLIKALISRLCSVISCRDGSFAATSLMRQVATRGTSAVNNSSISFADNPHLSRRISAISHCCRASYICSRFLFCIVVQIIFFQFFH